jgi:isopentenyldiphosphate isomerase
VNGRRELLQRVDPQGQPRGAVFREQCHGNPDLIHGVVHLYVLDPQGRLYLQKRSAAKDSYPGCWDTSVGGHIQFGERVEAALERESREELGLSSVGAGLLGTYLYRDEWESEFVWAYALYYSASIDPNPDEVETGRYFTPLEIKRLSQMLTPNFRVGYQHFRERLEIKSGRDRPHRRS